MHIYVTQCLLFADAVWVDSLKGLSESEVGGECRVVLGRGRLVGLGPPRYASSVSTISISYRLVRRVRSENVLRESAGSSSGPYASGPSRQ